MDFQTFQNIYLNVQFSDAATQTVIPSETSMIPNIGPAPGLQADPKSICAVAYWGLWKHLEDFYLPTLPMRWNEIVSQANEAASNPALLDSMAVMIDQVVRNGGWQKCFNDWIGANSSGPAWVGTLPSDIYANAVAANLDSIADPAEAVTTPTSPTVMPTNTTSLIDDAIPNTPGAPSNAPIVPTSAQNSISSLVSSFSKSKWLIIFAVVVVVFLMSRKNSRA